MSVSPTVNCLNPPPLPEIPTLTSTSGATLLNSSATASVIGATVLEPSISIVPRNPARCSFIFAVGVGTLPTIGGSAVAAGIAEAGCCGVVPVPGAAWAAGWAAAGWAGADGASEVLSEPHAATTKAPITIAKTSSPGSPNILARISLNMMVAHTSAILSSIYF